MCHPELVSGSQEMPKQACPEEILNPVQNDTFSVQHDILDNYAGFSAISICIDDKRLNMIN